MAESSSDPFDAADWLAKWHRDQAQFHGKAMQSHNEAGEILELAAELGKSAAGVEGYPFDVNSLRDIIASGLHYVGPYEKGREDIEQLMSGLRVNSTNFAATATSSVISGYYVHIVPEQPDLERLRKLDDAVSRELKSQNFELQLRQIDPSLVPVYRQAIQQLYATGPDVGRTALSQVRQLWDHLFDRLAPNPDVEKAFGITTEPITRRHRLEYVLQRHVDPTKRAALERAVTADLNVRDRLEMLHKRGQLNDAVALATAKEGVSAINKWLDAIRK